MNAELRETCGIVAEWGSVCPSAGGHPGEHDWRHNPTTAELREIRNAAGENIGLERAYHTMTFGAFLDAIGCSKCDCTKSGDAEVPNSKTEACGDSDCPCHKGIDDE